MSKAATIISAAAITRIMLIALAAMISLSLTFLYYPYKIDNNGHDLSTIAAMPLSLLSSKPYNAITNNEFEVGGPAIPLAAAETSIDSNNHTLKPNNNIIIGNSAPISISSSFSAKGLIADLISPHVTNKSSSITTRNVNNITTSSSNNSNNQSPTQQAQKEKLATRSPYVLAGYWILNVIDGKLKGLDANFTMVTINGTGYHTHEFANFKPDVDIPILLDRQIIPIVGMMDIKVDGKDKWFGVQTTIQIKKLNTISIYPNPKYIENHFQGVPIYGIVLSVKDKNGVELIKPHI